MVKKINIQACYCKIPRRKLLELVRLHFVDGIPTEQLMKRAKTRREREYLATVALLDLHNGTLESIVDVDKPLDLSHFLSCHAQTRGILREDLFNQEGKRGSLCA
jgi:hypothetical protein